MFPECYEMNDSAINLSKTRCETLVKTLNILCKDTRYAVYSEQGPYHIYDKSTDLILTTGKQVVGAFQYNVLNWKE